MRTHRRGLLKTLNTETVYCAQVVTSKVFFKLLLFFVLTVWPARLPFSARGYTGCSRLACSFFVILACRWSEKIFSVERNLQFIDLWPHLYPSVIENGLMDGKCSAAIAAASTLVCLAAASRSLLPLCLLLRFLRAACSSRFRHAKINSTEKNFRLEFCKLHYWDFWLETTVAQLYWKMNVFKTWMWHEQHELLVKFKIESKKASFRKCLSFLSLCLSTLYT